MLGLLLVLTATIFDGFSQILMKKAAPRLLGSWLIVFTIILSLAEALVYSYALELLAVSIAYAVSSVSFATVTLFARWMLKEKITTERWVGVSLILCGGAMVAFYV